MIATRINEKYVSYKNRVSLHELMNGKVSLIAETEPGKVMLNIRITEPGRYIFNAGKKRWEYLISDVPFFDIREVNKNRRVMVTEITDEEEMINDSAFLGG